MSSYTVSRGPSFTKARKMLSTVLKPRKNDHNKIVKLTKKVRQLKPEIKFFDTVQVKQIVAGTSTNFVAVPLNIMKQGDDASTRSGNKIRLQRIMFRCHFNYPTTGTRVDSDKVRIVIFQDRENQGALASIASIFSVNPPQCTSNYVDVNVPGQFKILKDKSVNLPIVSTSIPYQAKNVEFRWRLKPKITLLRYNGNAGTVADLREGALFMYAFSDDNAGAPSAVVNYTISFDCRIYYTDV